MMARGGTRLFIAVAGAAAGAVFCCALLVCLDVWGPWGEDERGDVAVLESRGESVDG